MNAEQARKMYIYVSEEMIRNEEYLTEIDNKAGDGDHGTGMAIGFRAVKENLEKISCTYVNQVFHQIGMTLLSVMGGASGGLFGTVFIRGSVDYPEKTEFGLQDFSSVFRTSLEALKKRGKARIGDKTMVDALEPAVRALGKAADEGKDIRQGFREAAAAARDGMEATKSMKAGFGRAKYYREKALGIQDAGATSVYLIFRAMQAWTAKNM